MAELLAASESGDLHNPLSSRVLQAGIVLPGESLRCTLKKESILARNPRDDSVFLSIAARSQPDVCDARSKQHKV